MKHAKHHSLNGLRPSEIPIEVLLVCLALTGTIASACTQGAGEGSVSSNKLFVHDCWDGEFNLQPSFFGANPLSRDVMAIRVQRGDDNQEVSDGLSVMVNDVQAIRGSKLGTPLAVGLPPGVSPLECRSGSIQPRHRSVWRFTCTTRVTFKTELFTR